MKVLKMSLLVSSFGGDIMGVKTPNIDRIGQEGLRLSSFYAQPSCTAGRAAFITGQLPVRTGLTTVGTPGSPAGLQKGDITLAEILKTRGYTTAQFGKNHLGDLEEHLPPPPWLRRVLGQSVSPQR